MKKFRKSFFCMLFFLIALTGCKSITLERQYTEFYTVDGVGYICEYIHGERITCKKKEETANAEKIVAFF